MTILKDLLNLKADTDAVQRLAPYADDKGPQVTEARGNRDMHDAIEKWMDREKAYSFEGPRGVRNFSSLVKALNSDYRDIDTFLEDNPGALQAMVEWIQGQRQPEWLESIGGGEGDDEDEDDR